MAVVSDMADIQVAGGLALRDGPNAFGTQIKTRLPVGAVLKLLEPAEAAKQKIGVFNQWLNVQAQDGTPGWVAAWLVFGRTVTAATKRLEPPTAGRKRGPRELDVDTAIQPPLRPRQFVVVSKRFKQAIIRSKPRTGQIIGHARGGAKLESLESLNALARKVDRRGQWIKVRWKKGLVGYVSSQYVELPPAKKRPQVKSARALPKDIVDVLAATNEPDARPVLKVISEDGLNLRIAPGGGVITVLSFGALLLLREPIATAGPKIGEPNTWVAVATIEGVTGFVSGEFVALANDIPTAPPIPGAPTVNPEVKAQGVAFVLANTRLLNGPSASSASDWSVTAGTPLRLLNPSEWDKVGNPNAFVHVESFAFKRGFARGDALRAPDMPDRRQQAVDTVLPFGICAWLYGLHDAFDRSLFASSGKTGWVLMTHRVVNGEGMNYEDWSRSGYGVIARLNNDYGGSGTIPTPDLYDAFADQCKRWVANSKGNLIWVIGNEMNNPREWPNQDPFNPGNNPNAAIIPENYAACFNKVRAAIKSVQPRAIVVPGALDPFQGPWMSCLDYWNRMMAAITDLDAIALHCYTNGYTPDLVTSLDTFQNDPLRWQYFHFRAYSTFLDAVPPRHRLKPVYITETDPTGAQPWSGGQNGWVQAAYGEIERWNWQAQSQQIQTLILYRWSRDDIYSILDKPGVQNDIRATINGTDYRWRT
jgi:hypothetical protein